MVKVKALFLLIVNLALANTIFATVYTVNNKTDLQSRMAAALPGDTVIVSNGTYDFQSISFINNNGSSSLAPIVLKAQTVSGVVFTGTTRLSFKGNNIVVEGFKFANGNAGTNAVIRLGTSSTNVSNYCRITNITIDNYNSDSATENEWIGIFGVQNRVDHCTFINKFNARATVVVWYSATTYPNAAVSTYHRIDSNYFKGRGYLGANGGETIRVGDSNTSRTDGFNIIEYNLFEDMSQTEPEIISNKSDFNTYRYNTFRNCKGGLTLRHGRYCDVYGNFFIITDNSVTEAYGIRIIDKGHRVYNNYMEGLNGNASGGTSQNRAPINLMNGLSTDTTDASAASGYFPADSCIVAFNSIVNAMGGGGIVLGGTTGGTIQPKGIVLANNGVKMVTGSALYRNSSNTSLTFSSEGNMYEAPAGLGVTTTGWQNVSLPFGARENGVLTAPAVVQDAAVNTSIYAEMLAAMDAQRQTRSAIYDVGADELNGTGAAIARPLNANDVGAGNSSPMPVRLIEFNAKASGNNVVLSWTSANEESFKHYEIETSITGSNFINLGKVNSKNTGSVITKYSYDHLTPSEGKNFYRLKMVDINGALSYSVIRNVTFTKDAAFSIFPNPASSVFTVNNFGSIKVAEIIVADASGRIRKVISSIDTDKKSIQIDVSAFTSGTYTVQLREPNTKLHTRLLTIKR